MSIDRAEATIVEFGGKSVNVIAFDQARDFVRDHGGSLYLWATVHGVYAGKVILLEAGTERPSDEKLRFQSVLGAGSDLCVSFTDRHPPEDLVLELARGGKKIKAFWNNWAYVS
ncbi:MAG: hypothetical protein ACLQUT_02195 [Thermoleophilia bacterium]